MHLRLTNHYASCIKKAGPPFFKGSPAICCRPVAFRLCLSANLALSYLDCMVDTRKNLRVCQPQNLTVNTNFEVLWYQAVTCVNHISTLLLKHCHKKQETEECNLKICGYIYLQGTYTPQAGTEKGAGFFTVYRC